jgi:hypothetical protein
VIRSLAVIMHALSIAAPHFHEQREAAVLLRELSIQYRFDALTEVAIMENESHGDPRAISDDGSYGLTQPRLVNFRECRDLESEACVRRKASLLEWRENLRVGAKLIAAWKTYCKRTVGTELASRWLQGFQGLDATHHRTCGFTRVGKRWVAAPIPDLTRRVLARRKELAS